MFNNITIEKAKLLQEKLQEIKSKLDQDIFTYSENEVGISISVLGNIKNISNPQNKTLEEIIPIINEALSKARQDYEIKQAQLLQKEMIGLM